MFREVMGSLRWPVLNMGLEIRIGFGPGGPEGPEGPFQSLGLDVSVLCQS